MLNDSNSIKKIGIGLKKNMSKYSKIISFDEKKIKKLLQEIFLGFFRLFQKMTFLFQSASEERRNFLDQMISVLVDNHKKNILNYEKHKMKEYKKF